MASSGEVLACRVCLATDGRLYAVSGSGLEDTLAAVTGVALSAEENWPCHLCVFCHAKLSKCVAFRDSCQRTTALLQTLLEKGPLKMNVIKAFNRKPQQLVNNFTTNKLFQFETNPFKEIMPQIKAENNENSHEEVAVEYLEDIVKYDANDVEMRTLELPVENRVIPKIGNLKFKVEGETENPKNYSEIDNYIEIQVENDMSSDVDTDTSEETLATIKTGKRKRVKLEKENETAELPKKFKKVNCKVDGHPTDVASDVSKKTRRLKKKVGIKSNTESFEKRNNCKMSILSKEEQKQHVEERKWNSKSAYSCDLCGKGFKREDTLMTHKTYHDPSLPAECDVCLLRFRSRRSLLKHMDCHRAIFTCNECGNVSRNRAQAKHHNLAHQGTTYTCPYCQALYRHQTSYCNHIRRLHPGQHEACDLCGETFAAGRGVVLHKALAHRQLSGWTDRQVDAETRTAKQRQVANAKPNVDLECSVCDVKFLSAAALRRHAELSAGAAHAGLWPCARCGRACRSPHALATHAAEQHPPQQLNQHHCDECNKTFSDAASFALHADRKHNHRRAVEAPLRPRPGTGGGRPRSGPGPVRPRPEDGRGRTQTTVCDICGKVFPCLVALRYHMNHHLGLKPYQCSHCPKAFANKSNRRMHMRVHTGERPYQCEQCPQAFSKRGNFTKHVSNVHLRVKVKCDICGKVMSGASIAAHVRAVHLKQPYPRRNRKRDRTKKLVRVTES